jgi:site-specific DNA-methyltransferase (adenine-specific)
MSYIKHSDCFDEFKNIKPKSIDFVCVDLPYGQTACGWDSVIDLQKMWVELKTICKEDCIYAFFCTTKFGYSLINSNPKWFRYDIVWEKTNTLGFLSANKMPLRKHEMIYIFRGGLTKNNPPTYNPQKTKGKPYKKGGDYKKNYKNVYGQAKKKGMDNKTGDRHPTSIIKFNYDKDKYHRTQKPVELCEWLIKTYSNKGDLVLDFTMGSGSTIVACKNTGRRYIGIEKDKEIYEIAEKRIKEKKRVLSCN